MLEMRNVLQTKLNKKGFTLAELLVVVAIIAILVAVSIPIFTGKLNEARKNTDIANVRAAKAAAVSEYLNDEAQTSGTYYDAKNGAMVAAKPTTGYNAYGGQDNNGLVTNDSRKAKNDSVIEITITDNGSAKPKVVANWVPKG